MQQLEPMTCLFGEPAIEEFYNTASEIEDYSVKLARHVVAARAFNAALTPGRVVLINTPVRAVVTLILLRVLHCAAG